MTTVPLVNLLDSLLQKAYHDLIILQELLRNKSDGDRKMEIVKYAQQTRALLIRLLALVKWAGNSTSVQKCSEMSVMLSQQSGLYVDTADQLVQLVRTDLVNACAPNFSLAPALDVLTTGSYPRLPTCIKDRAVPLPPLKEEEEVQAYLLINSAIRHRLLKEPVPDHMKVTSIDGGVVKFKVPYEFELCLSVLSEDVTVPWRLISLQVVVGEAIAGTPVLLHQHQKLYLHQLIQSRLYTEDQPLKDCYQCLHAFCLALQLDCLHSQAVQLSNDVYGGYIKVEEYSHAHHLKVIYWRPGSSHFMSAYLLDQARTLPSPRILVCIDPSSPAHPFSTHHSPPLPAGGPDISIAPGMLSLESLLKGCIQVRSRTLLDGIKKSLKGTSWDDKAELHVLPVCLRIAVPVKYGRRHVVLGVDSRVGNIVVSLDPPCSLGKLGACLEDMERAVTSSWTNLPAQLEKLQCHLFVAHVAEIGKELDLPVHWNLPLVHPFPFTSVALLHLELMPLVYLVVGVSRGLKDQYYLLSVSPSPFAPPHIHSSSTELPPPPRLFLSTSSLIELDLEEITLQHLKMVRVTRNGPLLKRKLLESCVSLPSLKKVCVRDRPDIRPLPALIQSRMALLSMETSLNAAGISNRTMYTAFGFPTANIFSFPQSTECLPSMHKLLSSSLQSCHVSHSNSTYACTFVFSPLDLGPQTGDQCNIVLRRSIPAPEPRGSGRDLGQTLLGQWRARVTLLGLTLELQQYLDYVHWPLHTSCAITDFTYDKLFVSFKRHQLYVETTPTGLSLGLSAECPHLLVKDSLEAFLCRSKSLSLLLQGVCLTELTMNTVVEFVKRVPTVAVSATAPTQIQLTYDNSFAVGLRLQANSSISFTDIRYLKPIFPTLQLNPSSYFQTFLHSVFTDCGGADSEDSGDSKPMTRPHSLHPIPSPISYPPPRRTSYPESVPSPRGFSIPSIPPFPSPALGSGMGHGSTWNCQLSLDQFNQLLSATPSQPVKPDTCVVGCSLLQSFLGSMVLLFQGLLMANKYQLMFLQCDRGVYSYRTETISISMAIEGAVMRTTLRAVRDNAWSSAELDVLMDLFKRDVMSPPFSAYGMNSFLTLLILPLQILKSCVQLILNQQATPSTGMIWQYTLYLTIPHGADLVGAPFTKGNAGIIYGRAKLLLFLKFERIQDRKSFILPVMYDPKTNITYVAKFQNQYRNAFQPIVDAILKKASSEMANQQLPGHGPRCSLYPAIRSLAQSTLSVPV